MIAAEHKRVPSWINLHFPLSPACYTGKARGPQAPTCLPRDKAMRNMSFSFFQLLETHSLWLK